MNFAGLKEDPPQVRDALFRKKHLVVSLDHGFHNTAFAKASGGLISVEPKTEDFFPDRSSRPEDIRFEPQLPRGSTTKSKNILPLVRAGGRRKLRKVAGVQDGSALERWEFGLALGALATGVSTILPFKTLTLRRSPTASPTAASTCLDIVIRPLLLTRSRMVNFIVELIKSNIFTVLECDAALTDGYLFCFGRRMDWVVVLDM